MGNSPMRKERESQQLTCSSLLAVGEEPRRYETARGKSSLLLSPPHTYTPIHVPLPHPCHLYLDLSKSCYISWDSCFSAFKDLSLTPFLH
jgi:hypothetical protein